MGLGDAKIAASTGLALGWTSWQALLAGTPTGFVLAAAYGGVLIAAHRASRSSHLPLGPLILHAALAAIALLPAQATGSRSSLASRNVKPGRKKPPRATPARPG